jgi:hypothetical protein
MGTLKKKIESKPLISDGCDYFARIDLAGIEMDSCASSVTSMVAIARADSSQWARPPTGAVSCLKNLVG